jgi:hypothetical protein
MNEIVARSCNVGTELLDEFYFISYAAFRIKKDKCSPHSLAARYQLHSDIPVTDNISHILMCFSGLFSHTTPPF